MNSFGTSNNDTPVQVSKGGRPHRGGASWPRIGISGIVSAQFVDRIQDDRQGYKES